MDNITMEAYFPDGNYFPDMAGIDAGIQAEMLLEVMKAFSATGAIPRSGPGVNALQIEDVQPTLASAEIRERQLHAWKRIPKQPAKDLTAQFSRADNLGDTGFQGFMGGGDAGFVSDGSFTRGSNLIKYIGVKGQVDLPTQLIELIGFGGRGVNAMATNQTMKMMELLRLIERALFFGNTNLDNIQWKGFIQAIDEASDTLNSIRLDLQGAALDRYILARISQITANNSSDLTDVYIPNEGLLDLSQSLFPNIRTGDNIPSASVGVDFKRLLIETMGGDPAYVDIKRTQMLTFGVKGGMPLRVPLVASVNGPQAPSSVSGAAAALTTTAYQPGLAAGTYGYSVVSVGKGGWSLGTGTASGVTATASQKITLTISCPDAGVLFYMIFRNAVADSATDSTVRYFLARTASTGPTTTWVDDGYARVNTYHAVALSYGYSEIYFKQLLPIVKRLLPQQMMMNEYGLLCFGTPVFEVPTHNIHLVNIGRRQQAGIAAPQIATTLA